MVNTHEHFDHTFGNGDLPRGVRRRCPIHAHEMAAEDAVAPASGSSGLYDDEPDDPHRDEVQATEIVPADRTFSSAVALDLGDRAVELVHPGRGHTGGDLVRPGAGRRRAARRRPGRGVGAPPGFGADSLAAGVAAHPRHRARPEHVRDRRRARARRAGRPRLRRGAAQRDRRRRRDDPRPGRPRRARRPRPSRPSSGPTRARSSRPPYAVATSTSPAARSGCPSSERVPCLAHE